MIRYSSTFFFVLTTSHFIWAVIINLFARKSSEGYPNKFEPRKPANFQSKLFPAKNALQSLSAHHIYLSCCYIRTSYFMLWNKCWSFLKAKCWFYMKIENFLFHAKVCVCVYNTTSWLSVFDRMRIQERMKLTKNIETNKIDFENFIVAKNEC